LQFPASPYAPTGDTFAFSGSAPTFIRDAGVLMLGIVFVEFSQMVEQRFSPAVLDAAIDRAAPASGGAYTAVGSYPHAEMVALVSALSHETQLPVPALIRTFGEYMFDRLAARFPMYVQDLAHPFELFARLDGVIHKEVRMLYPEAELPKFVFTRLGEREADLVYSSPRHLADLAEGLIVGALSHFGCSGQIGRHDEGPSTTFRIALA